MFDVDIESIKQYSVYKEKIERDLFTTQNLDMNLNKPIYGKIKPGGNIATLRFECLFQNASRLSFLTREKREYLEQFDSIIDDIRALRTEKEYMDSRCYPTGLAMKGNIMVVGEAPGTKGRAGKEGWLKPSFVFTRTSWILRRALMMTFKVAPYLSNVCKFARPKNVIKKQDFEFCIHILQKEIDIIKPEGIIVLGKKPYDFLKKRLDTNVHIRYVPHPSYAWRCNWDNNFYSHHFLVELGNFRNAKIGVRI